MSRDELKVGLDELADKLGAQYQLDCGWESDDCLSFRRSGLDGNLSIGDRQIDLTLNLGILMSAFRAPIEQEIRSFIAEHIY